MANKYKIKKSDLKALFASADMIMEGHYHQLYKRLGLEQGSNKNFHCFNLEAHGQGSDAHASMSIDNKTGKWHCFTCDIRGNFQSYFAEYLKGNGLYGDSYTDFIIDFLNMKGEGGIVNFSKEASDPNFQKNREELHKLYEQVQKAYKEENGKSYMMSGDLLELVKKATILPMELIDRAVSNLLNNQEKLDYLKKKRNIDKKIIERYRIGLDGRGKFLFPTISAEGDLINLKAYDPTNPNRDFKWSYPFKGYDVKPVPIDHFTHQKIYFFEGEPDCYCAIGFGIAGAVTLGSRSITDVNEAFGIVKAKQIFNGKEIVIVFDSDESGREGAEKLARSVYPYCKQVKIVDLDKSDINPNGLDDSLMHEVISKGKSKMKRVETDFTDWMVKNGFDEKARRDFDTIVDRTKVYTMNEDRLREEVRKVTLQEARMSRNFSPSGEIKLNLVASVSDFNCDALMYPTCFSVACRVMKGDAAAGKICDKCILKDMPGFDDGLDEMVFNFVRGKIPREHLNNPFYIKVSDHNLLGLVEVTDLQKMQQQKKIAGVHPSCPFCVITDLVNEKLLHVRLSRDVNEFNMDSEESGNSDIDMEAYMMGDMDIYPNRSYHFDACQTTAWNGQQAVLFSSKAEPVETTIESFHMDLDTHQILRVFQPKAGESIEEHLERRYEVFSNAAGITGRKDIFQIMDFSFFSPVEINNKRLLPQVTRGWVETLIAGESRCGKTVISKFLKNHYKVGEFVAGSSAVSRTGLLGGVTYFKNRPNIAWGKIPMNDGGLLVIDELSNLDLNTMSDLTACRSDGIAEIQKIKGGKAPARTRKIMLSNQRVYKGEKTDFNYGIEMLQDLCFNKPEILARFDICHIVKEDDVDVEDFAASYEQIGTEFTEYQCQNLIMWGWSRRTDDIVFEEGIENHINKHQIEMLEQFHPSTQLINREMRAKLVRLSISLATMLYSIVPDDYTKVLVKKEHVDYVVKFLTKTYCHKNMNLDTYSKKKYKSETLGDMEFMTAIFKYVDIEALMQDEEYSERAILQIFYDYIGRVASKGLFMVDAKSDKMMETGLKPHEGVQKLIGVLTGRNCMRRTKGATYKKTSMFNKWLSKRLEEGDGAKFSDMLDSKKDQLSTGIIERAEEFEGLGGSAGKSNPG